MSSELIIHFCAPTLAGLKAGSLFSYRYPEGENAAETIRRQNLLFNSKGIYFEPVRQSRGAMLVYVYRRKQVEKILSGPAVQEFLRQYGYCDFCLEACLKRLKERLQQKDFPHEIGVFLDYPLPDIQAFIANKGENFSVLGCWKVYTNVDEAVRKFASFKKCTEIYSRCYLQGADLSRLTLAG